MNFWKRSSINSFKGTKTTEFIEALYSKEKYFGFHACVKKDFHVKNKAKMNKVIKMMISASSHVFLIGPLPFDHGTDPKDEFVSDIVEDKHFVLSLLGLSFIIGLQFRIVPYSRKSAHVQLLFHHLVGHMVHPGAFLDTGTGGVLEGHNAAVAGKLFRIFVPGEKIGEDGEV